MSIPCFRWLFLNLVVHSDTGASAQMTDDDLKSLFAYLHSLPPTRKVVGPSRREAGWTPKD